MNRDKVTVELGGLDERATPAPGTAARLVNMTWGGSWRSAPGMLELIDTDQPVRSLGTLQARGRAMLLVEFGDVGSTGLLGVADYRTGEVDVLLDDRLIVAGPSLGTGYATVAGWCYITNGRNAPVRYDGRKFVDVGYTRPPSPPSVVLNLLTVFDRAVQTGSAPEGAEFQRGVGPVPDPPPALTSLLWKYCWRITYVNDLGSESEPSKMAWANGTGIPVFQVRASVVVQGEVPPPNTRAVRIYRSINLYGVEGGGIPDVYLVAEVAPAEIESFVDDFGDDELGEQLLLDELGPVPTGVLRVAQIGGQMLAMTTDSLHLSAPLRFEQFPPSGVIRCGSGAAGAYTALVPTRGNVLVFRERGIYAVGRGQSGALVVATVSESIGTRAGDAVLDVPGVGVVFLADDGPYVVVGADDDGMVPTVRPLGTHLLRRTWRRVAREHLARARASLHARESEAWFAVPHGGDANTNLGIVFHYPSGQWSIREGYATNAMVESDGEFLVGTPSGVSRVTRAAGQLRECAYRTNAMFSQDQRGVLGVALEVGAAGRETVTVRGFRDREVSPSATYTAEARDPNAETKPLDVWGEGRWGGKWRDDTGVRLRSDLELKRALDYQFEVRGGRIELIGLTVELSKIEGDPQTPAGRRP